MSKDRNIQTRVDEELYEHLSERAEERGLTMAEYLRTLVSNLTDAPTSDDSDIKRLFIEDIVSLGGSEDGRIVTEIEQSWDEFTAPDKLGRFRELLFDTEGQVYLSGQGSSLAAAGWMAARLRDNGIHASAHTAERIPRRVVDEEDVVVCISRSGKTENVQRLCSSVDATTVGFTSPGSDLYESDVDLSIPVPTVPEYLGHYSKQNFVVQILLLQTVLSPDEPELGTIKDRLAVVHSFVREHITFEEDGTGLSGSSPFARIARRLNREDDLSLDPIATGIGRYGSHCYEFVQKYPEILYEHADTVDPGTIRDRLLNLLYTEQAYVVGIIPRTGSEAYDTFGTYMFKSENSVNNLLKYNQNPIPLRLLCFTFNEPDNPVELNCVESSLYDEQALIPLPSEDSDPFVDDLVLFVAIYIYVYALLERKWEQEPKVRQAIIRRVFTKGA